MELGKEGMELLTKSIIERNRSFINVYYFLFLYVPTKFWKVSTASRKKQQHNKFNLSWNQIRL